MVVRHFMVYLLIVPIYGQFEGDKCIVKTTGTKGKCTLIDNCDYAKDLLRSRQIPQNCGFRGLIPVVCCPIITASIPGQKSEKQCGIYYPKTDFKALVFGGKKSLAKEFPHMAILGYGDKDDIQWLCGGSLISAQFVLTAAHCVISQYLGIVKWVRLGDLDIKNTTDYAQPQDFTVITHFVHPKYRTTSHYDDIALLKLDREVKFTDFVKPACLYGHKSISKPLIATGWGRVDFLGEPSSHLMKVDLQEIDFDQCHQRYAGVSTRKLVDGILDDLQICAGASNGGDTCPGDSGGPLQFKETGPVRYRVVGITSFGKGCGIENSAGVYTRVSYYIDWIEDIVWPPE